MKNSEESRRLILSIDLGKEVDDEQLDQVTRQLRSELLEMDVETVEFIKTGDRPEGTKSAEAVTLGSLAIVLLPSLIPKLLEYLQSWSLRGESRKVAIKTQAGDRSIELEYTPTAISPDELQRLVQTLTGALEAKQGK